jgi:hypothetical protein
VVTPPGMRNWSLVALGLVLGCGGTESSLASAPGVGNACLPAAERSPAFSGFATDEVTIETGNASCQTGLCLVNHFRGRVSCPYGQDEAEAAAWQSAASWGNNCRVPGTNGEQPDQRIQVPVDPELEARQAASAVTCSCRCANAQGSTDDGASYCGCGAGFVCEPLLPDLDLGATDLAGSFCVRADAVYDEATTLLSPPCVLTSSQVCGEAIPY